MNEKNATILRFLVEFRKRLLRSLFALIIIFVVLLYFSNTLYSLLAMPLLKQLPRGQGLIATNIIAPFFVPFKLTFFSALFLAIPIFLYQLWAFVMPALYRHERRLVWLLLLISTLLFYVGVAFAYFVIFPIIFHFFTATAPQGVIVSPDISQYLDFTLQLFFIFGVIFEVPVITILLVWSGTVTRTRLKTMRPYVIVGAFIVGMFFAPPDVLSQTLLAVPLYCLFELGVLFSLFFVRNVSKDLYVDNHLI